MNKKWRKKISYKNKIIEVAEKQTENRLTIDTCRKTLRNKARHYTDEQVALIRDYFYDLASIAYEEYEYGKATIVIPLIQKITDHEESYYLRAS